MKTYKVIWNADPKSMTIEIEEIILRKAGDNTSLIRHITLTKELPLKQEVRW